MRKKSLWSMYKAAITALKKGVMQIREDRKKKVYRGQC